MDLPDRQLEPPEPPKPICDICGDACNPDCAAEHYTICEECGEVCTELLYGFVKELDQSARYYLYDYILANGLC